MKKFDKVYFVGGGIAALAGACYLVRDIGMDGKDITILEELPVLGGSNDGAGDTKAGYTMRGGRMWNRSTYENTWELFDSIPSLEKPDKTLRQEIFEFDEANPTNARARLVDASGHIVDATQFGFDRNDKMKLFKLIFSREKKFENVRINEYFGPHFFATNFWKNFCTTFAFNPWHSVLELRRYMRRFLPEIDKMHNLSAVLRTPYNQYDSVTVPLMTYLNGFDVNFATNCTVTDIDFKDGDEITVNAIHVRRAGQDEVIIIAPHEAVIITNGCMTDTYSWGNMTTPPEQKGKGSCFSLWDSIASKKPNLGHPERFDGNIRESSWGSFTVTFQGTLFFDMMEQWSGNRAGTGALVTFKDSNWLCSLVLAYQPHFKGQPKDVTVCFGVALFPYSKGNYVDKPFNECTGEEVMTEMLNHLHFERQAEIMDSIIDCKPLFTPLGIAQFMLRSGNDRPQIIPQGSTNIAFIGQFCEMKDDVVFTEEYSVRSARTAVYGLFDYPHKVEPVKKRHLKPNVLLRMLKATKK